MTNNTPKKTTANSKHTSGVSLVTVRALLSDRSDEAAVGLGQPSLKHLKTIAAGPQCFLAVKAVHIAGATGLAAAAPIVEFAARSRDRRLRTAAAASVRSLPPSLAEPILLRLLKSRDISVRKWAVRSAGIIGSENLRRILENIFEHDSNDHIRKIAQATLTKVRASRP
jgi:HEAT repeat protein